MNEIIIIRYWACMDPRLNSKCIISNQLPGDDYNHDLELTPPSNTCRTGSTYIPH